MNNMAGALKGMVNGGCTVLGRSRPERLFVIKPDSRLLLCDLQPVKLPETRSPPFPASTLGNGDRDHVPRIHPRKNLPLPRYESNLYFSSSEPSPSDKPSLDKLQRTYNILQQSLERTFTHSMDYTIYHQDIVFIDNIRSIRTQGLPRYIQQVALLKTVGHLKFAYVKFDIIKMSVSQEEGRITVRWRIKGLSGTRVMLKFWKYKLWRWKDLINQQETWYDGISYFDVGEDGRIFQHIADKVMEDKNTELDQKPARGNIPLAAKLGTLAVIFPTPSLTFFDETHCSTISSVSPTSALMNDMNVDGSNKASFLSNNARSLLYSLEIETVVGSVS